MPLLWVPVWNEKLQKPQAELLWQGVQVLSRYSKTGRIAAQASTFGAGKVVLVGPHLEADEDWYENDHLSLQYGLNHDLFREVLGRL